jgi:hypothetical protein
MTVGGTPSVRPSDPRPALDHGGIPSKHTSCSKPEGTRLASHTNPGRRAGRLAGRLECPRAGSSGGATARPRSGSPRARRRSGGAVRAQRPTRGSLLGSESATAAIAARARPKSVEPHARLQSRARGGKSLFQQRRSKFVSSHQHASNVLIA